MNLRRIAVGRALVAAGLIVAIGLVAAPADAGGSGRIKARIAKQPGGPYVVQVQANIGVGKAKVFYVKVKNNTPDQPFDVNMTQGDPSDENYKQRYFRFNGTNITSDVEGSGYEFHLEAQQVKRFEVKIKAIGAPDLFCSRTNLDELGTGPGQGQVRVGVNGADCD
jgi:hypothetical protein